MHPCHALLLAKYSHAPRQIYSLHYVPEGVMVEREGEEGRGRHGVRWWRGHERVWTGVLLLVGCGGCHTPQKILKTGKIRAK